MNTLHFFILMNHYLNFMYTVAWNFLKNWVKYNLLYYKIELLRRINSFFYILLSDIIFDIHQIFVRSLSTVIKLYNNLT